MNNDIMRRRMLRDYARNRRGMDRRYNEDMHRYPQMYSNEYAMGGRVYDGNPNNRYTPQGYDSREPDYRYSNPASAESDYARYGDNAMRGGRYDSNYYRPFAVMGKIGGEAPYPHTGMMGRPDYNSSEKAVLSEHELRAWAQRLMHSIDEKEKGFFTEEHITRRAKELGMSFEKYTEQEFFVTVLMQYTDFSKTLGTANLDTYLKIAKDWLCDDDIALRYGEKLAAYYDTIVEGA